MYAIGLREACHKLPQVPTLPTVPATQTARLYALITRRLAVGKSSGKEPEVRDRRSVVGEEAKSIGRPKAVGARHNNVWLTVLDF